MRTHTLTKICVHASSRLSIAPFFFFGWTKNERKVDHCFDLASSKRVFGMRHFFSYFFLSWLDRQSHPSPLLLHSSTRMCIDPIPCSLLMITLLLIFALLLSWLKAFDCVFAALSLGMTPSTLKLLPFLRSSIDMQDSLRLSLCIHGAVSVYDCHPKVLSLKDNLLRENR
ncbi:hypothetical protein BKA57DRAFT_85248 [Linnemannia elongata]|nr:hypothetical protein BKA57DRAFT_85248 [Linnemannia elongata]